MRRISRLLIANRGEIAVRIARTAREMGISTVAVYSDADSDARHVQVADEAVRIGAAPARESYLCIERILEAARRTGADAVHPGYGFLSEQAEFAQAVADAELVFVGPSPSAIRAMGKKREAKEVARSLGVPVVPGYAGERQEHATLVQECQRVGLPVLLKASAGGGGKGMRVCRMLEEIGPSIDAAKREALAAFGDDTLIVEKYLERPRHVEVQILGDAHGNLVHLFERECSIQRRHQKIIEETPSTALTPELRARMGEAAVAIGRAIDYTNAGTVEFILDGSGSFYFLEVNTRLQVEHPITECVTGLDLVREQLRIARGEPLGFAQADLRLSGAALECRLYAEDPAHGFLPQSGALVDFEVPGGLSWLRVDAGVESGSEVTIHYDPLLAKVITHGRDREEATQRMLFALQRLVVSGVVNNRALLLAVLRHPMYARGDVHTHFLEEHADALAERTAAPEQLAEAAIAAALHAQAARRADGPLAGARAGFRNNPWRPQQVAFSVGERALEVSYSAVGGELFDVRSGPVSGEARRIHCSGRELVLELAGRRRTYRVVRHGERTFVSVGELTLLLRELPRFPEAAAIVREGSQVAPMPGRVVKVEVGVGERVAPGQRLVTIEAMKMEHVLKASAAGVVEALEVAEGQQVDAEQVLLVVRAD